MTLPFSPGAKAGFLFTLLTVIPSAAAPALLDEQFELPEGFHIYKAASSELSGGSYDLVFDGQGHLLVGDGKNLRRLTDSDGDQVYDTYAVIAEGLGGRGPQGLVVYGDHLYAVGGDGMQLFSGVEAGGKLKHERRLSAPFHTGGDHSAHTVLRGLDGYLYFVTGDGGGARDRVHITEASSPVRFERNASVFRFDPTGEHWECIAAGGRNPPSLGMNYLGELFSFDSDMEWHVDLPFYRPVRLNHWPTGGDNGWQSVGAYPPYYLDCLPGVLDVGRGSPDWGIFYEHHQFPERYRDAFLVCDYQWKSATSGGYANPGRLVSFQFERHAATWKAAMTVLAQPKPGAVDEDNQSINFAPVDVDVAPDGSLLISDHNQGVWRLFYDPQTNSSVPPLAPRAQPNNAQAGPLEVLLSLPQPKAEWSRLRELQLRERTDGAVKDAQLHEVVLHQSRPLRQRLRALRLLAPNFPTLEASFIRTLTEDPVPEIRAQAAWLIGIRKKASETSQAITLLEDKDPFVRRRAAEIFTRHHSSQANSALIQGLSDPDRFVRYAAMTALSHRPTSTLMECASQATSPHAIMRLLVATDLRRERADDEAVQAAVQRLFAMRSNEPPQDTLDFLRILGLFRKELRDNSVLTARIEAFLLQAFPAQNRDIRWEQTRLLGEFGFASAFGPLLDQLDSEEDGVTQFHLAEALSRIESGWTEAQSARYIRWLLATQSGWFADFNGKGRQFPGFWGAVLTRATNAHSTTVLRLADGLQPDSQLAKVAYRAIVDAPGSEAFLLKAYASAPDASSRQGILSLFQQVRSPKIAAVLLEDYERIEDPQWRASLISALASQPVSDADLALFWKALLTLDERQAIERCVSRLVTDEVSLSKHSAQVSQTTYLTEGGTRHRGEQAIYFRILELMTAHPDYTETLDQGLQALAGHHRPDYRPPLQTLWLSDQQNSDERAWFVKTFTLPQSPSFQGELIITCDNTFVAHLNGERIGRGNDWTKPQRIDVRRTLRSGHNVLGIEGLNQGGPGGLAAILRWRAADTRTGMLVTDTTWKMTGTPPGDDWHQKKTSDIEASPQWRPALDVSGPTSNVMDAMASFLEDHPGETAAEIQEYWQAWYLKRFREPFTPPPSSAKSEAFTDSALHQLITGIETFTGDAQKGRQVYLNTGCFACHGGAGQDQGSLFGPPLQGVTARLTREELADAVVYPSKQVSDRFKATELTIKGGQTLSGFITEQSEDVISITDLQNNVTRLDRADVKSIQSQHTSLMPAKLLNTLRSEDVQNLMAFLHAMKP